MSNDQSRDDDALVLRCRKGDPEALATLYRRHAGSLCSYLERLLGGRSEAEDILQETFLRVFEGRGRYEGNGRFRAWLFTVATRLARDRLRDQKRQWDLASNASERLLPPRRPDALERVSHRELAETVESVLLDLPRSYGLAFHLRVRESFTYADIAAIEGTSEGTLRSRVFHTLRRVREALEGVDRAKRNRVPTKESQR